VVWDGIMKKYDGKWRHLAVEQSKTYFSPSADNLKDSAKMYVFTFSHISDVCVCLSVCANVLLHVFLSDCNCSVVIKTKVLMTTLS